MTIDLPAWERLRVSERCAEWVLTTGRASHFPDQDALNAVLMDEQGAPLWQEFDPIWNAITTRFEVEWISESPRRVRPDEIRLRHFAGSSKPWNTEGLMLKSVFDEHLAAVPFPVPAHMRIRQRPSRARRLARRARRWVRRWIPAV
jgi:lipopolysaccharide biosynthesis glycosyltransferase